MDNLWITFLAGGRGVYYTYNMNIENMLVTKVTKQGSSLGIVIPKPILTELNICRGDYLVFGGYAPDQLCARRLSADEIRQMKPKVIKLD